MEGFVKQYSVSSFSNSERLKVFTTYWVTTGKGTLQSTHNLQKKIECLKKWQVLKFTG